MIKEDMVKVVSIKQSMVKEDTVKEVSIKQSMVKEDRIKQHMIDHDMTLYDMTGQQEMCYWKVRKFEVKGGKDEQE